MRFESQTILLTGEEVSLRPLVLEDAPKLAQAIGKNLQSFQLTFVPQNDSVEEAELYIQKALSLKEAGKRYPFLIQFKDQVVGTTSFCNYDFWEWPDANQKKIRIGRPDVLEIGYTWLALSAQRTRCNTEAKYLLLSHAFSVFESIRVCFKTDERNAVSRKAIERLGAKFEGIRRAEMLAVDGTPRNSAYFSILKEEWPSVKLGLENFLKKK